MLSNEPVEYAISDAHSWVALVVGQIVGDVPWQIDFGPDPNTLRTDLEAWDIDVPPMRDMDTDPIGNMMDWRDFLASLLTVH